MTIAAPQCCLSMAQKSPNFRHELLPRLPASTNLSISNPLIDLLLDTHGI
jgi:hypothetical protein